MTAYIIVTFTASLLALIYLCSVSFRSMGGRAVSEQQETEQENKQLIRENAELRFELYKLKLEMGKNEEGDVKDFGNGA